MHTKTIHKTAEDEDRAMDWRPELDPPSANEPANPAANPGPRGNQDIDEYDYRRGRERLLGVLGG